MTLDHPVIKAIATQLTSLILVALFVILLSWDLNWFQAAGLQGVIAATISFYSPQTPYWWRLIHLLFIPALIAVSALQLPAYWFLIGFISLALIFGRTYRTQVPLFLSSQQTIQALVGLLPQERSFRMVDLGSGCGGVIFNLARVLPNGHYDGVEAAILPCWIGKLRARLFRHPCQFHWKNIWQHDLGAYDVVYAYLSPVPMPALWQKATQEMRPGSLLISNTFTVPGITPDHSITLNDFSGSVLYVWRMK